MVYSTYKQETLKVKLNLFCAEVEITSVPSNVTVVEGSHAILNCSANIGLAHRLVWYTKPNREVVSDDRIDLLPDGPLVFNVVRKEDEGFYQCSVKLNDTNSSKSKNTHWAYLKVHGTYWTYKIKTCYLHKAVKMSSYN